MRLGPRLAALLLVGGLGILGLVHEDYYMELGPRVSGYRALRIFSTSVCTLVNGACSGGQGHVQE